MVPGASCEVLGAECGEELEIEFESGIGDLFCFNARRETLDVRRDSFATHSLILIIQLFDYFPFANSTIRQFNN